MIELYLDTEHFRRAVKKKINICSTSLKEGVFYGDSVLVHM